MKKIIEKLHSALFTILCAFTLVSFLFAFGGEFMPTSWVIMWVVIHIISLLLCVFVFDSRVYYRRIIPLLVCIASITYVIFRPFIKSDHSILKRCYGLKVMAGNLSDCYAHVQAVYDEFSGYTIGDTTC